MRIPRHVRSLKKKRPKKKEKGKKLRGICVLASTSVCNYNFAIFFLTLWICHCLFTSQCDFTVTNSVEFGWTTQLNSTVFTLCFFISKHSILPFCPQPTQLLQKLIPASKFSQFLPLWLTTVNIAGVNGSIQSIHVFFMLSFPYDFSLPHLVYFFFSFYWPFRT